MLGPVFFHLCRTLPGETLHAARTCDLPVLLGVLVAGVLCAFPLACEVSTDTSCDPTRFPGAGRQSSCFGVLHGVASESYHESRELQCDVLVIQTSSMKTGRQFELSTPRTQCKQWGMYFRTHTEECTQQNAQAFLQTLKAAHFIRGLLCLVTPPATPDPGYHPEGARRAASSHA